MNTVTGCSSSFHKPIARHQFCSKLKRKIRILWKKSGRSETDAYVSAVQIGRSPSRPRRLATNEMAALLDGFERPGGRNGQTTECTSSHGRCSRRLSGQPSKQPSGGMLTRPRQAIPHRPFFFNVVLAPQVGLEPTTLRLTAECSAIELLRSVMCIRRAPGT
jgi:hypothetical protein